jgi:DnaJ-class molecular chaperone
MTNNSCDLYSILHLNRNASQDDIKKAYKQLALQHHPDKKGGDDIEFKKINEAYQILSDPNKRKMYDVRYEDNVNLDILYNFATVLMGIVQEKLNEKLKSSTAHTKTSDNKYIVQPIILKIKVDIEEIHQAKVKKLIVKVRRREGEQYVFKSIPIYISLLNYENKYVFENQGDDNDKDINGERGDIIVNLEITSDVLSNVSIDTLFCKYDLHMECDMTLYEYLYGLDKCYDLYGININVVTEPLQSSLENGYYVIELDDYGLPYVEDDDDTDNIKRGKIYIHYKLKITTLPRDVLLEYKNIFKTYFNTIEDETKE